MEFLFTAVFSEISGSYGDEYEDDRLLGYCAVFIALMMKAVSTFETSASFYETAKRNIPKGCHLHKVQTLHPIAANPSFHNVSEKSTRAYSSL
jgi:hypothetical protein